MQVWNHTDIPIRQYLYKTGSWLQFFQLIDARIDYPSILSKVLVCLWGVWNARNRFVFSGHDNHPKDVAFRSLEMLCSYLQHSEVVVTGQPLETNHPSHWLPPNFDQLMLNTDASFSQTGAGFGYVLRDHMGAVIKSGAGHLTAITSAEHAEVMAIWKGFEGIQEYWTAKIVIATDCKKIISQFYQPDENLTMLGSILEGLKFLLSRAQFVSLQFCPRLANGVAHRLAKIGHSLTYDVSWLLSSHPLVLDTLHCDWVRNHE